MYRSRGGAAFCFRIVAPDVLEADGSRQVVLLSARISTVGDIVHSMSPACVCAGSIPEDLGKLKKLEHLELGDNQLTGEGDRCALAFCRDDGPDGSVGYLTALLAAVRGLLDHVRNGGCSVSVESASSSLCITHTSGMSNRLFVVEH